MSRRIIRPVPNETDLKKYLHFRDDFVGGNRDSTRVGERNWLRTAITGAATDITDTLAEAGTNGVAQINAANAGNDSTVWSQWRAEVFSLVAGFRLDVRIKGDTTTDSRWWLGLCDVRTVVPIAAGAVELAGFRYDTAIDQIVYGVTKTGAAAETTVSCGAIDAAAWHTYSFDMPVAGTVRFWRDGVLQGQSTTNIPTGPYVPLFGIQSDAAVAKDFLIDFYQFFAPLDRG